MSIKKDIGSFWAAIPPFWRGLIILSLVVALFLLVILPIYNYIKNIITAGPQAPLTPDANNYGNGVIANSTSLPASFDAKAQATAIYNDVSSWFTLRNTPAYQALLDDSNNELQAVYDYWNSQGNWFTQYGSLAATVQAQKTNFHLGFATVRDTLIVRLASLGLT